jgi:hypothetical protein
MQAYRIQVWLTKAFLMPCKLARTDTCGDIHYGCTRGILSRLYCV